MLNFQRKSKYHQTAGAYSVAGYRTQGRIKFLLWHNKKLLGCFDNAAAAVQYANAMEEKAA